MGFGLREKVVHLVTGFRFVYDKLLGFSVKIREKVEILNMKYK